MRNLIFYLITLYGFKYVSHVYIEEYSVIRTTYVRGQFQVSLIFSVCMILLILKAIYQSL